MFPRRLLSRGTVWPRNVLPVIRSGFLAPQVTLPLQHRCYSSIPRGGYVTEHEARYEYCLNPEDLVGVETVTKSDPDNNEPWVLYNIADVQRIALERYGTTDNLERERHLMKGHTDWKQRLHYNASFNTALRAFKRVKRTVERGKGSLSEAPTQRFNVYTSRGVVHSAIYASAAITLCKIVAAGVSGSAAVTSDCIRSIFDTITQCTYGIGVSQAEKEPTRLHPYGFSQSNYFWALQAGSWAFLGSLGAIYTGCNALAHPEMVEGFLLPGFVLSISMAADSFVLHKAVVKFRGDATKFQLTFRQYVSEGPDPNTSSILAEDCIALCSAGVAGGSLYMTYMTGNPVYDAIGSISVGLLASTVALFNMKRNYRYLHNRSMPEHYTTQCLQILEQSPIISSIHDVKAIAMGADRYRFKAEIVLDSLALKDLTLQRLDVNMSKLRMESESHTNDFLQKYSDLFCVVIGDEIDRIEESIRSKMPEIRHVDIEPV